MPIASGSAPAATLRGPCQSTNTDTNKYYLVEPCSGGGSFTVNNGLSILEANAIQITGQGDTCYKVLGTTNTADQTYTPSGGFSSCAACNPPTCFGIAVEFAVGRDTCPTGGSTTVWSSTNSLVTASKLYSTQQNCQNNIGTAATGTYSFTFTNAGGELEKISRY